ncbi:MAG: hypothetical protein Q4E07_03750 [Eubacteriales bacterium]|nr:hypothetical protein [Eubacteriales bacterium]
MTEATLYNILKTLPVQAVRGPAFGLPLPTLSFSLKTVQGKDEIWMLLRAKTAEENDGISKLCDEKLAEYGFYAHEKKQERERDSGTFLYYLKYKVGSFTAIKIEGETLLGVSDLHLKGGLAPVLHSDGLYKPAELNMSRLKISVLSPVPQALLGGGEVNINIDDKPFKGFLREIIQKDGTSQIILDVWEDML